MANEIEEYIKEAREKKLSDDQIKATLLHAGWPKEDVEKSLSNRNQSTLVPPPPPPPVPHVGMWTGFLYIIFFISLYITATSVAGVFHVWVEKLMPGTKDTYNLWTLWNLDNYVIKYSLASLAVAWPILAVLAFILKKQILKNPFVKNIRSRKILIYITLVGTFLIMISHLISTIYEFLNGSGTNNAIGHFIVTILIAGPIFLYFLSEVKHDSKS